MASILRLGESIELTHYLAKVDKLSILGYAVLVCIYSWTALTKAISISVRSFDNTRSETIQFHTPLTLIVGYNGSGKTV